MKKRFYLIVAIFLIVVVSVVNTFLLVGNANYLLNCYYSKKLTVAIKESDTVAVREILEKRPSCVNASPNLMPRWIDVLLDRPREQDPLIVACLSGDLAMVELLVEANANLDGNEEFSPLGQTYLCKKENWYEISVYLIEQGASLNYVRNSSSGEVCLLEDIVKKRSGSALPGYIPENREEVFSAFRYALEHCDSSKVDWASVLSAAVTNDRIEIVKLLLDEKYCDVNKPKSGGMTALMFAARDSTAEMVSLLLEYDADVNAMDDKGNRAIDLASKKEIIDLLKNK